MSSTPVHRSTRCAAIIALPWLLIACSELPPLLADDGSAGESSTDTSETDTGGTETDAGTIPVVVMVTLDGSPAPGVVLTQGGGIETWTTGDEGTAEVAVDLSIEGERVMMASHPEARIGGAFVDTEMTEVTIALIRFVADDNEEFLFEDPGKPDEPDSAAQCSHCHITINEDWYESRHRRAASNPTVQDVYAGVASAFDENACTDAGGMWWTGIEPGSGDPMDRCYVEHGALPDLNEDCGDDSPCDEVASEFGRCADCHAPAINGQLGGRDLLEARGLEYETGVQCDLCHTVESVDLDSQAPGVAGRLNIVRPSEPGPGPGGWKALMFGPHHDVVNPRMGMVYRDHYRDGELCAGCHQYEQEVLVPGVSIDESRWPSGRLPVHTTYEEWADGPVTAYTCNDCHMPDDDEAINSANPEITETEYGVAKGWIRPAGEVKHHQWNGPRSVDSGVLESAAVLSIDKSVDGGELTATVTVANAGAGHAIPSGEPMRTMVLYVGATCEGDSLDAVGGDAIPDFGGAMDRKQSPEDWNIWPGAQVGDVVRVVDVSGQWHDYDGFGPFGEGGFSAEDKGMPVETVVGRSTITDVDGDNVVFDSPLPSGDVAYRGHADVFEEESDGSARAVAGGPGFAFARVMVADDGERMVPHHRAVDVASDNRVMPMSNWTSTHLFDSPCDEPEVRAVLVHRAYSDSVARDHGWSFEERVAVERTE